jgi:transcription elongation factor SPT4
MYPAKRGNHMPLKFITVEIKIHTTSPCEYFTAYCTFVIIIDMSKRSQQNLRACLLCSMVLPLKEFVDSGCPNCQDLLFNAHDGTTSNFEGTIALLRPMDSWVGKWQGLTNYVPGMYAVR